MCDHVAMFLPVVKKLAEDCCRYGNDNQNFGFILARASVEFGNSHSQMEKERENLLKFLGEQVLSYYHFPLFLKFSEPSKNKYIATCNGYLNKYIINCILKKIYINPRGKHI